MTVYLFPGQGSQKKGMGAELFDEFRDLTAKADSILGYSIKELCLEDPHNQLEQTQYTQPALFVVNALMFHKIDKKPAFVGGHSLGEYSALYAAESYDFETGLRLVQKRGQIMSKISGGAMAAIIGKNAQEVADILKSNNLDTIDVANFNSLKQIVISGLQEDIANSKLIFEAAGARFFPLKVSGAFHSRYMTPAKEEFSNFLAQFDLKDPQIRCMSNYTGKPYEPSQIKTNLAEQLNHSVKWTDSMQYLIDQGFQDFAEIGPGTVLAGLLAKIRKSS